MDWLERQRRLLAYRVQQGKEAVRDVFDANTQADQQRRLAAGQARLYQDQQAQKKAQAQQQQSQNRFRPRAYTPPTQNKAPSARPDVRPSTINSIIANTNQPNFLERNLSQTGLSNIGKETFGNFARFANTGQVVIDTAKKQVAEYPRIVASSVTGNKEATRASQERVKDVARKGLGSTGGIFNVGTVVDEEKSIPENLKRVAASSLGVAGEVAPVGKGIQLGKQGFKVGTKQFLKLTGQGAGAAGAANAGEQYMRTGEIKPSEVALSVATGGLITGGLGVGGELLNKLVTSRSVRKIEKELESAYPGVFGRDLNKVAKEISKTSDEVEINKIIDEYTNTGTTGEVVDGAKQVVKDTGEQTVDISKPTQTPPKTTDAVANGVANNKNPAHIKTVVDALLPNADETTKTALVNKLVKITDPEEIKKTLDEAAVRQAEITKATDNAIPTGQQVDQATQQEQALQEAVPQPVPARMAGESATTQEPTAPTPTAVTDATTATDVPGAVAQQTDKIIGSYTDPKTGQITGFYTEEDLLDKLLELKSIPLAKRSGADANSIQEIETILKNTRNQQTATPVAQVGKTQKTLDDVFNDPDNIGLFEPAQKQANAFQDTLRSKSRPNSVKEVVKGGGNPLYHDTDAKGIMGILDSGTINPSQAPFSQIAGQGKRVSTTRNFDNYSRYHDSPYRLVIDESKTGQKSIPDNREEFESIFNKPISTNAVQGVAVDITNPALIKDIQSGKFAQVVEKAKQKGITIEPFEGKILPKDAANDEIQRLTKELYAEQPTPVAQVEEPISGIKNQDGVLLSADYAGTTLPDGTRIVPVINEGVEGFAVVKNNGESGFFESADEAGKWARGIDEAPVNQADEIPPGNGTVPPTAPETPTITQSVQGQLEAEKKSFLDKIKDFKTRVMQEIYDPLTVTQKADDAYAKTKGYSRKQAELAMADRSITKKIIDMGNSSDVAAETFLKPLSNGESMSNVFNRWIGNDDGRPFMQYLIERFELEILEKQGIWKNANFTPEQAAKRVADFETQHGEQAITDAKLVKEWADNLVDEAVKRGEITAETANFMKNFYQNYVPLERAIREDVVRPRIVGGISATVGKQNIARYLTEAAGDYDNTLDALIKRAGSVIGQTRKNSVAQEFFLRAKDNVDGYRIVIDPEKTVARRQAIEEMTKLSDVIEEAKRGRNKLATKKKISSLELKNAQTEAAEKARQYYIAQAVDEKGVAWANGLSRAELLDMFDVLVTTDEVKAARIINKLSKKGDEYRNATNSLQAARDDIAALTGRKSEKFREAGALYEKAPTGENIVKGYIDGEQFAVIVPDDIAKTLDYMGKLRDDQLSKISGALATPQKIVATGLGAPQFLVKDVARRQSLKLTNTQGLSAFGLRPMTSYWASLGGPQRSTVYSNLEQAGFIPEKATKVGYTVEKRAKDIASRADTASRIKFLAKSPGRAWDSLNKMAAAFGNADRVQIGYGAYLRAKRLFPEISEQDAWAAGAQAANEALGNFRRTSLTARRLEVFNPYTSATQAGYRSLIRRYRVAPVETTIKTFGILGIIAAAAGLQSEQYADYYEDLINDKRTYDLDNNIVILTPLSNKSKETGNWENVIKIPLPPDLRPLYRAAWRIGYNQQRGIKQDVGMIAKEIGNFLTADQASSIYDTKAGGGVKNVFPQSPVTKTVKILANIDPRTGKQLVEGALANQPKEKQFRDNTSENAKWLSNVLSGMLSPIEIDALADQFGIVGDILQAKGGVVEAAKTPFKQIFTETKARTPEKIQATAHYKDLEDIGKTFLDDKQLNLWKSMYEKRQDEKTGMLDSATNALILLSNEDVLQAEIEKNRRSAERTGKSNPLYDNTLTQDQRDRVFMYRSMKAPNAAKQNYTKDGESSFVSLGLDEPWYQEFKKKEAAYWESVIKKDGENDDTIRTFSGKKKPQETPELQAKLDYYYSLPKGTGDRSRFLKANQDVLDFWASQNDFTDAERQALGFKPLTDEQDTGYNYGKFGYGGGGSAKTLAEQMSPDLSTLLAGVQPNKIKSADIIDPTPQKTKFKVKLPSSSKGRSYKRIRLQ